MKAASKFLTLIIVLFLIGILALGLSSQEPQKQTNGKLKIATTIFALADIAKNIGKDKIEIATIMPPGANPHTFEPTPKDIEQTIGSRIIFKIGYGLDDWTNRISASIGNVKITDVSGKINLRHVEGKVDPHYWLTFQNARTIAQNIADEISQLDPKNRSYYMSNLWRYQSQLIAEDKKLKAKFSGLKNKSFATFHEAFFYFAEHYGLQVAAVFEPSPGKEPTPEYLADFIKTIKENNIKVIFYEPDFSPAGIRQIAQDLDVRLDVLNPVEGTKTGTDTYIGLMVENGNKLSEALK